MLSTELSARNDIQVRVPTRDPSSSSARELANLPNVTLISASYESEEGLRAAFAGQDACYFLINTFAIREPDEYFWTIRAYEIAAQSGLKLFIYSGARNRLREQRYQEAYRNSHNVVKAHLSDWLEAQNQEVLPWCVVYGGVYAEMLGSVLLPMKNGEEYVFAAPVHENSVIPLMPLPNYGTTVEWVLEHPEKCAGRFMDAGAIPSTWLDIVAAFENTTGKKARFQPLSQEHWFAGATKKGIAVDAVMPASASADDPAVFTFRKTFGAWWNMWRDNTKEIEAPGRSMEEVPGRIGTLEEWMRVTKYQGGHVEPTKQRRDAAAMAAR
jgi:hypothetical protein